MKTVRLLIGGSPCTYWSICQKNNRRETEAKLKELEVQNNG